MIPTVIAIAVGSALAPTARRAVHIVARTVADLTDTDTATDTKTCCAKEE